LNLATRSLLSYQTAINTTGHNVANAGTEGYHRQRVDLRPNPPERTVFGALGTGVRIDSVQRVEDRFIEYAIQREIPILSRYESRADQLSRSELAFGEPSDAGLTALLDEFFDGWDDLASNPEDPGARESVVRLAVSLTDAIQNARSRIADQQAAITGEIARTVDEANRVTRELQLLNRTILVSQRDGNIPPDLEDRRDALVEELAELVGASAMVEENGTATVRIGGRVYLQQETMAEIYFDPAFNDQPSLYGRELSLGEMDGRIEGLIRVRDEDLAAIIRRLDEFAFELAENVNAIHAQGVDPFGDPTVPFFVIETAEELGVTRAAGSIAVHPALLADSARVVTGTTGASADNSIALDIAALRNEPAGVVSMLRSMVVDVGSRARESENQARAQGVVVDAFRAQRESISGVSLDEEAANLMRFQRSYQAAAQIITMVDELTETILSM
jgi:flagellar hook-associated protein 1 FlgK